MSHFPECELQQNGWNEPGNEITRRLLTDVTGTDAANVDHVCKCVRVVGLKRVGVDEMRDE